MARICILTPGQIGTNPRIVKEADALYEAGHEVDVIATRMFHHVEPRDQALMRRIGWRLKRIDLRSRWRLGSASANSGRAVSFWRRGFASSADVALRAYTRPLRAAALTTPADLYVAHYPDALPAAAAAARKYGAPLRLRCGGFPFGRLARRSRLRHRAPAGALDRGRDLPGCAYVTAASPGIADAYAEAYGIERPHVVLNCFPLGHAPPAPTPQGTARPGPSLYWFSQTIGPDRGLECAVRAVALAQTRPHLYLRGTPASGFPGRLLDLARSAGAGDRVHLLPPEEPDRMEMLAAAYDVGLVAETGHTPSRRLCLTNKLFSFLLAGIPPLLSDTPAHCRFAAEAGMTDFIYPREAPAALAGLLDTLLADTTRLAVSRDQAWRLGQERYNWERERSKLICCSRTQTAVRAPNVAD